MSSTAYRQLVLRLPDGLKETMRKAVAGDEALDGVDFTPEQKGSRRCDVTRKERIGKSDSTKIRPSYHTLIKKILLRNMIRKARGMAQAREKKRGFLLFFASRGSGPAVGGGREAAGRRVRVKGGGVRKGGVFLKETGLSGV